MADTNVQADLESLKKDLASLRGDLRHLADTVVTEGRDSARAAGERVQQEVQDQTETVRSSIVERPFTSVAVAAGFGVLLGLLWRGR
jgi:ElaB/YqjD/DUF883 family membrane-anchored ribosome-binding protein